MIDRERDERRLAESAAASEGRRQIGYPDDPVIADWLHIAADSSVEVFTGKVEVGQNARTALAQVVAEELCVPLSAIRVHMADTDRTPYDPGTHGSQTTPIMSPRLRQVAASARELLIDRAAERWQTQRDSLVADSGFVVDRRDGRRVSYGELTGGEPLREVYREDVPLTPPSQWQIAGRSVPKLDGRAIVTGQRRYTPDLALPGAYAGKVLRPPVYGATLRSLDSTAAAQLPDVQVIHDGDFVGVVAPTRDQATAAIAALRAEWDLPEAPSTAELYDWLRTHPAPPPEDPRRLAQMQDHAGVVAQGESDATHIVAATYTHAYIAHAPLEPRAAVAELRDGRLTVWTGTQQPFGVRDELAQALGMPADQIRVIVPDTGGAYGGKHRGDAAIEAARLARGAGRPVKLIWTREEEFRAAYFRPAGVIDIRAGVDADGALTFWEFDNYNSGAAGMRTPYAVANRRIDFHPAEAPLRQGSYRALAATANHFARESHVDELARAVGMDPLQFRLENLADDRMRAVLVAAAERFGWNQTPAPNHGFGIACGTEKSSVVATCAEVAVDPASGALRVVRVVQAFECGAIINPDGLLNQNVGALIQGLGGALFEWIDFADGVVLTDRFSRYHVPRFSDIPPIEIVLLDRPDRKSEGAGETPIIGIAPALGNAIFAACGVRLRAMPLAPDGVVPGVR